MDKNFETTIDPDRPLRRSLWRGWRRRCPACGAGHMMQGYLKVQDICGTCGAALHHHRSDDGPAWLTILIVGHVIGPGMLMTFTAFQPPPWVMASVFSSLAIGLTFYLLPRLKGAFVAFQWAHRLHGFGTENPRYGQADRHS